MSTQLPYRLELQNRRAIVSLLPELNEVPWADIEQVGAEILSQLQPLSSPHLLVDLCALNYMGSAQVALVVRMFKTVKEKSGKMVVANRDPMVLEVLTLAGLNKVWTIVDSRERALSMLGGGGGSSTSSGGAHAVEINPVPGIIALAAVLVAAVFVVIHFANPALIPSRGDLFGCLGAAAVAFLAGLWTMTNGNRSIGIGVLLLSMAALLFGVFELAKSASPVPAPPAKKPDAVAPADADADAVPAKGAVPEAAAGPAVTPPVTTAAGTPTVPPPGAGAAVPPANPAQPPVKSPETP